MAGEVYGAGEALSRVADLLDSLLTGLHQLASDVSENAASVLAVASFSDESADLMPAAKWLADTLSQELLGYSVLGDMLRALISVAQRDAPELTDKVNALMREAEGLNRYWEAI